MQKILSKLIGIILTIITLVFICSIIKLNILNTKYIIIIGTILSITTLLVTYKLFKNKTKNITKIILSILSVILIIIYTVGITYLNTTTNFIKHVTNNNNKEYLTYNVLVLKTSNYNKIKDLENKKIGFLSINYQNAEKKLKNKINFNSNNYDNTTYLSNSLNNSEIDAIVIESNYLNIISEENNEYMKDKKIIYKYKVAQKTNIKENTLNIKKPYIIYISGSDSRGTVKDIARSDVNIIVVVNPKQHKILMVSTPRDYYVQLHGTTGLKDKLTHAGVYGINTSVNTMQDLLDIKIDRYVKVSFTTVINVVDVIDGIDIYSDKAFNRTCNFVKGTQHVNGECALAFARERKTYASGDRHRGENQEQVLSKIIEKITTPNYITKYNQILKAIDGSFETNASYEEITSILKNQIDNPASYSIETYNLDGKSTTGPTYTWATAHSNNSNIMIPDENTVNTAKEKINQYLK